VIFSKLKTQTKSAQVLLRQSAEVISMQKLDTFPRKPRNPLIDFDNWAELARSNPDGFEARRAQAIEDMISGMPMHKQERMRRLQWKIDQVRNQAGNPMAACIKLSEMMWDSLLGPGGLKDVLERLGDGDTTPLPKAKVLRFQAIR
jgi:hypothetical protein